MANRTRTHKKPISGENSDDLRLAELIERGMKTKSVSRKSVMKILGQNT